MLFQVLFRAHVKLQCTYIVTCYSYIRTLLGDHYNSHDEFVQGNVYFHDNGDRPGKIRLLQYRGQLHCEYAK